MKCKINVTLPNSTQSGEWLHRKCTADLKCIAFEILAWSLEREWWKNLLITCLSGIKENCSKIDWNLNTEQNAPLHLHQLVAIWLIFMFVAFHSQALFLICISHLNSTNELFSTNVSLQRKTVEAKSGRGEEPTSSHLQVFNNMQLTCGHFAKQSVKVFRLWFSDIYSFLFVCVMPASILAHFFFMFRVERSSLSK